MRNIGNAIVEPVTFDVLVDGQRPSFRLANVASADPKIAADAVVTWASADGKEQATVELPYLNAGERCEIVFFFDGPTSKLVVRCRLREVTVKITERIPEPDPLTMLVHSMRNPDWR